ncbi:hypothetical protein TWF696_006453 [Orbilia brochopaga]
MRATIPATVDRFQQALDMLEIEILKAKAALHRDLTKYHKAAELARQKELEEEERRLALEREAEAERLRIQKASEEAEELRLAAEAAAAAEAEAAAAAAAAAAASADLAMALDEPTATQDDTDMDRLFEDVQDMDSLKDASAPPSAIDSSHPLEMSNIPLVAASASKHADSTTGKPDVQKADAGTNTTDADAAVTTATFEDPIILDSPLMPAADGDDAEGPSAVDLFGDDPLNPATENKEGRETAAGGASMSIEEQIDMDFLFAPSGVAGTDAAGDAANAAAGTTDDLFGDLDVGADGGKLDLMNLDIPGLDTAGDGKDGKKVPGQGQAAADIGALPDGASFDDLLASFGDGALLGNDGTSLFDDAFDIYNN